MRIYLTDDPSDVTTPARLVGEARTEREAKQMAARALGAASLRGLAQVPTTAGVRYYAPGADDDDGASVEIVY